MGMYCACGVKLSGGEWENKPKCCCDWSGWNCTGNWPSEKPNTVPINADPPKDGLYLVRKQSTCGDRYEDEEKFFVNPIRIDEGGYSEKFKYPIHWEKERWDDDTVYAWKELSEVTHASMLS